MSREDGIAKKTHQQVGRIQPDLTPEERSRLQRSAQSLKNALEAVKRGSAP